MTAHARLFKERIDSIQIARTQLGRSVVARRRMAASVPVGEVRGRVMRDSEYESDYTIDLENGSSLEPGSPFRFLNHSCDPNCELILWEVADQTARPTIKVWLHTLRSIVAGEELTIDYAWPAERAIPCRCNASDCRGWIVDVDELPFLRDKRKQPPRIAHRQR